jgi:hypothetical protein
MTEACGDERGTMTSLPWLEALRFSLRVMRKSFFKLFIPSMALSYVMGAFHVLLAHFLYMNSHFGPPRASIAFIMIAIMILLPLPIYAYLYPLLKRYVLFHGLQELSLIHLNEYKKIQWKIRLGNFLQLVKISLKRYLFQTLSFLLLMLPVVLELFLERRNVGMGIMILDIVFISVIALLPVTWSFYAYFFAELHVINEISQEVKPVCIRSNKVIRPNKKLFWPILSWKAILFVAYIALLFVLSFFWRYIATFCDSQSCGMGNGNLFRGIFSFFTDGLSESLSPFLTINFLFVSFPSVWLNISGSGSYLPYSFWVQLFFILLFGLLTAFFFLVETLSSVYFYHRCRGNNEEELTEKYEESKETGRGKPARNDLSF